MEVIHGLKGIKKYKSSVVALGVFDGVHLAHQRILRAAVRTARSLGTKSLAVTFWPHPQGEESLYSLGHRLSLIERTGIDACLLIKFTPAFAAISAVKFTEDLLVKKLGARFIFVGKNFRFGRGAAGDAAMLERFGARYNFRVRALPVLKVGGRSVSSSYIRRLIKSGKLTLAAKFLSRPVSVYGTVIKGNSLAGKLGFPTANIDPHHEVTPPPGIYAVKAMLGRGVFDGVCYIGRRPTFFQNGRLSVEVSLFGFSGDIYGRDLKIEFVKRLRPDKKFASLFLLLQQIKKDISAARSVLSHSPAYPNT